MRKYFLILTIFLYFLYVPCYGQFYETGQDPFSVKWKQIKTENYKLIFPAGFENNALKFASALDTIYPVIGKQLLRKPKRVSIVFHTQSSLSNGLVVYAPKRMELLYYSSSG
ncbi:MAG: hypothetical protein HC905_31420 [Bacteroidales bacterium]|nr:hypothetical protein [Bacteroidales bacterium]